MYQLGDVGVTGASSNPAKLDLVNKLHEGQFPAQRINCIFYLFCGMWLSVQNDLPNSLAILLFQWIAQRDELLLITLCSNSLAKIQQNSYNLYILPDIQQNFFGMNVGLQSWYRRLAETYPRFSTFGIVIWFLFLLQFLFFIIHDNFMQKKSFLFNESARIWLCRIFALCFPGWAHAESIYLPSESFPADVCAWICIDG